MSVRTVARKDLADAGRSKSLWAVTLLVLFVTAGITALVGTTSDESTVQVFQLAFQLAVLTLPIVALVLAKGAITGERESGSLRVLLSLPPSRYDVLLGKFLGRTALMLVATLVGGVATAMVVVTTLGGGVELLVPFVGSLGLMTVAFVAVGVGISAASATDGRANAFAVGAYMLLVALWNLVQAGIRAGATELGLVEAGSQPAWLEFLGVFPPNRAAVAAYESAVAGGRVFAADPFASVWFPVAILFAWIVVPVAFGYLRFRDADIA
ncbi:ABC transporter permease subunit [Halorubellus salinus]|uniref:ABC transporter permease subunit n=1 Tax=Halorubellus salinus TaxID=755309 RepID=UPI001D077E58